MVLLALPVWEDAPAEVKEVVPRAKGSQRAVAGYSGLERAPQQLSQHLAANRPSQSTIAEKAAEKATVRPGRAELIRVSDTACEAVRYGS
jgi:hypothetical protein